MKYLGKEELIKALPYRELVEALREGFKEGGNAPLRHFHSVKTSKGTDNSFLIMPCWQEGGMMGVKMVMVCPDNPKKNLGSVQSTYILSDAETGVTKALLDGDELTARRTSSASALASSYLSSPDASTMLMMGAGKIATHLIRAHCAVRDLKEIFIWNRDTEQGQELATLLNEELSATVTSINDPEQYANTCDIISCATMASEPILKGAWLSTNKKQHIDLVGGYTYDMREADNDVIKGAAIYVDTFEGALAEAGDILRPIEEGVITRDDVKADLYKIVSDTFEAPTEKRTVFKSVGTALEDLIAAKLAFDKNA